MTYYVTYETYGDGNFLHIVEDHIEAYDLDEARDIAEIHAEDVESEEAEEYANDFDTISVNLSSIYDENGIRVA